MTPLGIFIGLCAIAIIYIGSAVFLCCELQHDHEHWWCPACLLFGKDERHV